MPANVTPILLPSRSPELNPVENVWQYLRPNWLSNRVFETYDDIIDAACDAWNKLIAQPQTSSPQSACAIGLTSVKHHDLWYYTSMWDWGRLNRFLALQLRLSRAESRLKCHFSYRLALGEHGFPFQDRFPGFDIFVIDAFRAASDRVNREFVEYSEYARGDPVANACEMAQTLAR